MGGHLGKKKQHNTHDEWINEVEAKIKPEKHQDIDLDCDTVRKRIRRIAN